ncbi:MAG: DUF3343 domain-containing protein [Clostridia bacterium]
MDFLLAVFRSRTETISFANILSSYGVNSKIINTPRSINVSCGISVLLQPDAKQIVENILARRKFSTFGGLFKIKKINGSFIPV